GGIAALDINGDGKQEVILGTQSIGFPLGNGTLRALDADGNVLATCTLRKSPYLIVTGDFDGSGAPQAAVGMAEGDVYLLKAPPRVVPPVPLTSVASRKTHGTAGTFDVDLT